MVDRSSNGFSLEDFAQIKVIGVGGGGSNAVDRMIAAGVQGGRVHYGEYRCASADALAGPSADSDR
jgi:cell division GTPase FtsZ